MYTVPCGKFLFQKVGDGMQNDLAQATLSNQGRYTVFTTANRTIRFLAPFSLERYTAVKKWDNGYLVVMAKYKHNRADEEEYIDLRPILDNLYIDANRFLTPIKEVRVLNG